METNDERIERIEFSGEGLEDEDFKWLIQQAERAQQLEQDIDKKRVVVQMQNYVYYGPDDAVSYELIKKNSELRNALEKIKQHAKFPLDWKTIEIAKKALR